MHAAPRYIVDVAEVDEMKQPQLFITPEVYKRSSSAWEAAPFRTTSGLLMIMNACQANNRI